MSETANGKLNGSPVHGISAPKRDRRRRKPVATPTRATSDPELPVGDAVERAAAEGAVTVTATATVEPASAPVAPPVPPPAAPLEEIKLSAVEVVEPPVPAPAIAEAAAPPPAPSTDAAPAAVEVAPQEPPAIVWYLELPQPDFPTADAVARLPSSVIYSPDVDRSPMKGLAFDLRAWGYGHVIVMRLAAARNVRLNDGRIIECPAGQPIIVPIVTDLESLIPPMLEHPLVALEVEFAPIGIEIDAAGHVRVRFAVLPPVVTEVARNSPSLWISEN